MSSALESKSTGAVMTALPPYIRGLFGGPPLVNTEDHDAYDGLLSELVLEMDPHGIREWMWVRDLADLNWDILRIRRAIASVFNISFKPALVQVLRTVLPRAAEFRTAEELAEEWYATPNDEAGVAGRARVVETLASYGLAPDAVVGQVFSLHWRELEKMEHLLASAERRRNAIMRELEVHRASAAGKKAGNRTIDAEPAQLIAAG
jgi:hypothetical protein